jgi:hypothetical protein
MKLVRLITGEEVIASIEENSDNTITIKEGVMLLPAGEGRIGMVPFMPYSDGSPITISKTHVMFMTNPSEDLYRQVLRATTGLETPDAGLKIIT